MVAPFGELRGSPKHICRAFGSQLLHCRPPTTVYNIVSLIPASVFHVSSDPTPGPHQYPITQLLPTGRPSNPPQNEYKLEHSSFASEHTSRPLLKPFSLSGAKHTPALTTSSSCPRCTRVQDFLDAGRLPLPEHGKTTYCQIRHYAKVGAPGGTWRTLSVESSGDWIQRDKSQYREHINSTTSFV